MLRTLPEERKKKKTAKKTAVKKTPTKSDTPVKKQLDKKTTSKKKTTGTKIESKMPPISNKAKKEVVKYKDGTTSTYGEYLEYFESRVGYIMRLNKINPETVDKIVYVNSSTACLTMTGGKESFLAIGKEAEEVHDL